MRLKSVTIKDFKRFTALTVRGIPETARLIVLAGPNGCGKSSFFDALITWNSVEMALKNKVSRGNGWNDRYHSKSRMEPHANWTKRVQLEVFGSLPDDPRKAVYSRSAYRNEPQFQIKQISRLGDPLQNIPVKSMIENDASVSRNFQKLVSQALEGAFVPEDGSVTLAEYKEHILGDIRSALRKLFPDLTLDSLGNPMADGTFRFTKGVSEGFPFMNLSGGEKAAFDLILDLVIARRSYDDTIFCIDEPEAHMNTRLQAELLSALYDLVPENCQLMLATHSIGMMRRARDIAKQQPGSVVFLDFGGRDFDQAQIIEPAMPDRTFWERAYQVALDDLAALVAPERVVICEGQPQTPQAGKNHSMDAQCYNRIFENEFPETRFVSMGSHHAVLNDRLGLENALKLLFSGTDTLKLKMLQLIDRDDRSEKEIADLRSEKGFCVLSQRNLESYLFVDEVLKKLAAQCGKADKTDELLTEKQNILATRKNDPPNDLKPGSGQIYVACKNILGLSQVGNDSKAFMRDTLAPLIVPEMTVYEELKHDIFGKSSIHRQTETS